MRKKKPCSDARIESMRGRLVGMVFNAIATGLDGPEEKRVLAVRAIRSLVVERDHPDKCVLWKKLAAILALSDIELFFEGLGSSLTEVIETLEGKRLPDKTIVKRVQEVAEAWESLGRIGD